jgi:hypothetical protein
MIPLIGVGPKWLSVVAGSTNIVIRLFCSVMNTGTF